MNANMYYNNNNYGGVNEKEAWKPAPYGDIESGHDDYKMNTEREMRLGFIRKVYGILSMQLLLTTFMCVISMSVPEVAKFQLHNQPVMWGALILSIIIMLVICCVPGVSRQVPVNYFLLFAFTICEGYIVSTICAKTNPKIVLMAAAMTTTMTLLLTLYACTTKTDFTLCGSMLFIISFCLLILSIFAMFFKFLAVIVATIGIFLYAIYLVYDTQLLMGNKENSLDLEDYILGALMLYMDIINMFLYILEILKFFNSN
jgi:FtsH-binding integral membrane protein